MLTSSWKTNWSNWMTHNLITWGLQMYINQKLGQKRSLNSILIWTNSSRRMKHCEISALFLFIIILKPKLNLSLLFIKLQIVPFRLVRSFGALNDNFHILLVSSFEVTQIMTTSFQLQSHLKLFPIGIPSRAKRRSVLGSQPCVFFGKIGPLAGKFKPVNLTW